MPSEHITLAGVVRQVLPYDWLKRSDRIIREANNLSPGHGQLMIKRIQQIRRTDFACSREFEVLHYIYGAVDIDRRLKITGRNLEAEERAVEVYLASTYAGHYTGEHMDCWSEELLRKYFRTNDKYKRQLDEILRNHINPSTALGAIDGAIYARLAE